MPENRRLTAIMFTDIVGYTALMGKDERKAHEMIYANRKIQLSLIHHYDGTCLKEMGDGVMASFPSAINAVLCAVKIQQFAMKENIPLRIGIHQGDVIFENNDVLGDGVNIASRIEQATKPGSISISQTVYNEIKNKPDIEAEFLDEMALKNVTEPVKVYKVKFDDNVDLDYDLIKDTIPGKFKWKRLYTILTLLAVITIVLLYFIPKIIIKPPVDIDRSIAVLPFDNESADESNIYFVNGMTEDIRNNLAKIEDLRVISKTSVEKYRNTTMSIKDIAKELDVNYLLEGTVLREGDRVKIHAQLISSQNDDHIWAETYVKDLIDVFSVQSEIAQNIAKNLHASITPEELGIIEIIPSNSITAYDIFLRARDQHNQFWLDNTNGKAFEEAIVLYHRALDFDSTFARAYTGLALAFLDKHKYLTYLDENYLDSLLGLANKALSFDDQLDEAYYVRGRYYASQKDGLNESLKNMNRALEINPNYVEVYRHKSTVSAWVFEDYVEAIKNDQIAIKLDQSTLLPNSLRHLSDLYSDTGFFNEARKYVDQAFILDNDSVLYYTKMAWINLGEGQLQEGLNSALQGYQIDSLNLLNMVTILMLLNSQKNVDQGYLISVKLLDLFKAYHLTTPNDYHRIGYFFWQKGKQKEAENYFDEQEKWCEESIRLGRSYAEMYGAHYDLACVLAFRGETERAIELLAEINNNKNFFVSWYINQFENEPFFDSIKDDERFQKILEDMKAKYQNEHDRVKAWMKEEGQVGS